MLEETGLLVEVGPLLGSVQREAPGAAVFDIHDYSARVRAGTLLAGDDAAEARWVTAAEYAQLATVEGLTETLRGWSALPRDVTGCDLPAGGDPPGRVRRQGPGAGPASGTE
jgi:hypothetical protein